MKFKLVQKIIDKIRGKKQELLLVELKNQVKQLQDFVYFRHEQNLIFNNITTDTASTHSATGILKELQEVNFYILKRLKSISDRLNIKFWLHGGSLLGAVRHKGFIPWDDDIDIGILHRDFEILNKYLENDEELEIKNFYFVPGICSRQPRVVFRGSYKPFFVDLFIYDELYTDDIDKTWREFCAQKNKQVEKLCATGIGVNCHFLIENQDNKRIVDEIYEKYHFKRNDKNSNAIIFNIDEGTNLISSNNNAFVRCFKNDFIFPLTTLKFCNVEFYAPKNYEEYLIKQYGNYMLFPKVLEYSQHMVNFDKKTLVEVHKFYNEKVKNIIGYTAGAFDLFHIGHLNLLKRAKENCNYLIVGITTDELIEQTKGHKPAIPYEERVEILKACKYVDEVVIQDDLDKVEAWKKYHYNVLFSGNDWENSDRWKGYEKELNKQEVQVIYFPYTKTTSSTAVNKFLKGGHHE